MGLVRTGLVAHRLGAVHLNLLGGGGDLKAVTADLIGGQREGLACGGLEGHSALEGAKRDGQASSGSLRGETNITRHKNDPGNRMRYHGVMEYQTFHLSSHI